MPHDLSASNQIVAKRRLPDRCLCCGRFVGYYPVGFYDDRYCRVCWEAKATAFAQWTERRRWAERVFA